MSLHATRARPPAVAATGDYWRDHTLCKPSNATLFDRETTLLTPANMAALALCAACPVRRACLADILTAPALLRKSVIAGGVVFDVAGNPGRPRVQRPDAVPAASDPVGPNVCRACSQPLSGRANKLYCDRKCSNAHNNAAYRELHKAAEKHCQRCQTAFQPHGGQKYCATRCSQAARDDRRPPRPHWPNKPRGLARQLRVADVWVAS